jgi:hypothetical protein
LIDISLDAILGGRLHQVVERNPVILDFGTIDAFAADWILRPTIEKVQSRIVAQLGNQMQGKRLTHHLHHMVVAKMAV